MTIQQLRMDYEDLVGKRAYRGWSDEELQNKMKVFREENDIKEDVIVESTPVKTLRMEEKEVVRVHSERHDAYESLRRQKIMKQLINIQPIMIKGLPMALIENEYVAWKEAELIMLNKLKEEIETLIKQKTAMINS